MTKSRSLGSHNYYEPSPQEIEDWKAIFRQEREDCDKLGGNNQKSHTSPRAPRIFSLRLPRVQPIN